MLKIHHSKHTRSLRVVWIAEELGVTYESHHVPFDPATLKSDEFLTVSPFGALPAIEDGGVRMVESGAICQYLTEKYGKHPFRREMGDPLYPLYLQWLHAGEATLTPPLANIAQHTSIRPESRRIPQVAAESVETFNERLQVLDRHLAGKHYLLGADMCAADVMVGYALHLASLFKLLDNAPMHVKDYWKRLSSRPAYQRAAAK
ncbi:MAG: glutathione S-transferase family protein [Hyphomonadaceae bacterium]|nr:MAG: glutathione S-transferase domain-containing protein [Caulobacteraceae bacterium]MBT9446050.1 glutathione S-transferase family protein [Hyphomonadaceae bacterium]TPW06281.1 MAG: glutathione S-transferase domain-containing protein [Alphaproteobacteria bacterium]